MNNVTKLRDDLFSVFDDLRAEKLQPKIAKELNNTAGKLISAAKAELEYYGMRREKPSIKFFHKGT